MPHPGRINERITSCRSVATHSMQSLNHQQHHTFAVRNRVPIARRTISLTTLTRLRPIARIPIAHSESNQPQPTILPIAFSVCTVNQSRPGRFPFRGHHGVNAATTCAISPGHHTPDYRKLREFPDQNQKTSPPGGTNIAAVTSSLRTSTRFGPLSPPKTPPPQSHEFPRTLTWPERPARLPVTAVILSRLALPPARLPINPVDTSADCSCIAVSPETA